MRFSKRPFVAQILALALVAMPAIATHAQTAGRPAPKVVELMPSQNEVDVGQKIQFSAIARDSSGKSEDEKATAWFAAPFDLATAAEDGTVTFYQPGVVTVGAIVGGRPIFRRIKVNQPAVKTIEIDDLNAPLPVGGTVRLQATARVFNGDPRRDVTLSWTSDNSKTVRVDAAGVVTGVAPGKATITVTAGEAKSSIQLNVSRVSLRGLTVEPANTKARTGDVIHFKALPQGARESYAPRWAVTGEGGRIDADGGFVAELPGSYIVSATIGDRVATASVVITPRNVERDIKVIGRAPLKDRVGAEQWIIGNYAYYSTVSDRFLVFDISDPSAPTLTDTINVDARIVNDISTTADGRIIVISREGASNRRNGIAFYDASDPARPKLISEYTETVTGGVHSAFVDGHYVYLTNLWTGDPNGYRPNMPFAWGAQPHKDMIFFNDMNSGLWIVKLGDPIVKGSTTAPGR
ncbi:MAG TPA: Ig-like domain-containing protein [Pyrinomonadaceae bacterium]|nr:Ig-like domain-containing protein [Pyrinomonadaceae bacterium]